MSNPELALQSSLAGFKSFIRVYNFIKDNIKDVYLDIINLKKDMYDYYYMSRVLSFYIDKTDDVPFKFRNEIKESINEIESFQELEAYKKVMNELVDHINRTIPNESDNNKKRKLIRWKSFILSEVFPYLGKRKKQLKFKIYKESTTLVEELLNNEHIPFDGYLINNDEIKPIAKKTKKSGIVPPTVDGHKIYVAMPMESVSLVEVLLNGK